MKRTFCLFLTIAALYLPASLHAANRVGDADNSGGTDYTDASVALQALYGSIPPAGISPLAMIDADIDLDLRDVQLLGQLAGSQPGVWGGPGGLLNVSPPAGFSTISGAAPSLLIWTVTSNLSFLAARTEGMEIALEITTPGAESTLQYAAVEIGASGIATADFLPANTTGLAQFVQAQLTIRIEEVGTGTLREIHTSAVTIQVGPSSCGNGTVEPGEECDDAQNGDPCDGCTDSCAVTTSLCGNGTVDCFEYCDEGGETAVCNDDCTWSACGDGVLNAAAGEGCDDGNTITEGPGECLADCSGLQVCGDGVANGTETCDDGASNGTGNGLCLTDCMGFQTCGDGIVEGSETCDMGVQNGTPFTLNGLGFDRGESKRPDAKYGLKKGRNRPNYAQNVELDTTWTPTSKIACG